jgi:hypothetical protein
MDKQLPIEHAFQQWQLAALPAYNLHAEDPILKITDTIDRIEGINNTFDKASDTFMQAVENSKSVFSSALAESLELVGKKLETQFTLVSKPLLESVAIQQGTLGAVQQQLASLEKRFVSSGHIAAPSHNWNVWLQLGCVFATLGLVGYNTIASRDSMWAQTSAGKTAKQITILNPQLTNNCRPLSAKDRSKLDDKNKLTKVCSIFL